MEDRLVTLSSLDRVMFHNTLIQVLKHIVQLFESQPRTYLKVKVPNSHTFWWLSRIEDPLQYFNMKKKWNSQRVAPTVLSVRCQIAILYNYVCSLSVNDNFVDVKVALDVSDIVI
jgi:hypothetical protein